jgi:D-alanine-D-alanine ligase
VRGCEITCGIIMGEPLPVIEIVPPGEIFDYDAKYVYAQGKTEYICPPKSLSEEMQRDMQALALAAYHALGARDLLRVDIIVGEDGPVILEGNTIPGFTPTSLVPKAAAAAGMPFPELCAKLVNAAVGRSQSTEH